MTRMDNKEYAAAFEALENVAEINEQTLEALTTLADERTARTAEALMGKRSRQSVKNSRFILLVNTLQGRFDCRLSRWSDETSYEVHSVEWSRWA